MTATEGLSVSPEMLREKVSEIAIYDEQLDAASGSEAAGKRALANDLAKQYEAKWRKPADQIVSVLNRTEDQEEIAGILHGIITALNAEFKEKNDAFLTEQAELRKSGQTTLSTEEINKITEDRKVAVEQYRALKQILELFGHAAEIESIPEPKKRTGARGKRGPRVLEGYDFYIDGEVRSSSQNNLSSIANTVTGGDPLNWKTADLRNFLNEKLAETGNSLEAPPEDGFEFELPNGKVLKAVPGTPVPVDETDEDQDQDENGDDDSENGESDTE